MTRFSRLPAALRALSGVIGVGLVTLAASAEAPPPTPEAVVRIARQASATPRVEEHPRRLAEAFRLYNRLAPPQRARIASELAEGARAVVSLRWAAPDRVLPVALELRKLDGELLNRDQGAARLRRTGQLALDESFLGHTYYYLRKYAESFQHHAEAIRLASRTGDPMLLGRCYANRAIVRNFRGELSLALEDWRAALRYLQGGPDPLQEARARINVADWTLEQGELEESWSHLRRAGELMNAAERKGFASSYDLMRHLSVRGELLGTRAQFYRRTGRPQEAIRVFADAAREFRQTGYRRDIMLYVEMADLLAQAGDAASDSRAERYYEIALLNSPVHDDPWSAMHTRIGYADYLARKGRTGDAQVLLDEALRVARAHLDFAHETACLLRMGHLLLERQRPDGPAALARFEECRKRVETDLRTPSLLWRAFHGRARALEALGRDDEALDAYDRAIAVIEEWLHGAYSGQEEGLRLEGSVWEPFEDAIAARARRGETEEAYRLSERLKGALLAETFNRSEVHRRMSAADRAVERRLRARVEDARRAYSSSAAAAARQGEGEGPAALRRRLNTELDAAEAGYRSFRRKLYGRAPGLQAARGELAKAGLKEAQAYAARTGATLLSYVFTRRSLLALVIDGRGAEVIPLPGEPGEVRAAVRKLQGGYADAAKVRASRTVSFPRAAFPLYEALIRPLERRLKGAAALCILPDEALWDVPFELLWTEADGKPRYLVERFGVSYAPSVAALLSMDRAMDREERRPSTLTASALVNPAPDPAAAADSPVRSAFRPRLALGEVAALQQQFGARVLKGAAASPAAALAALREYDLVHFGCHGLYDNRDPLRSSLGLGRGLTALDLANAEIRARLVVLAACETGRGEPTRGQGLLGLTWAAFVGGADACVATRWQVDDAATAALFQAFYAELRQGKGEREALRAAQLRLMRDDAYGAPYYWAGVMLVGR